MAGSLDDWHSARRCATNFTVSSPSWKSWSTWRVRLATWLAVNFGASFFRPEGGERFRDGRRGSGRPAAGFASGSTTRARRVGGRHEVPPEEGLHPVLRRNGGMAHRSFGDLGGALDPQVEGPARRLGSGLHRDPCGGFVRRDRRRGSGQARGQSGEFEFHGAAISVAAGHGERRGRRSTWLGS